MELINKVQALLYADMIDECYYLVIEEFVKYFAKLNGINITQKELKDEDVIEKIFYFLYWKMIENFPATKEQIYRLKELRYDVVFEKNKMKLLRIYEEYIQIYNIITQYELKSEKINLADELKRLTRNEEYELAVDVLEEIYYANKFRQILDKYNVEYDWYSDCEELSYKIKYNIEELSPYVRSIGYSVGEHVKYKLERLIDHIEDFENKLREINISD